MEWTGGHAEWRADLARGLGYALTVWPSLIWSFLGFLPWLLWLFVPGIILLTVGLYGEWLAGNGPQLMLTKRQSAAFVVATLVVWAAVAVAANPQAGPDVTCQGRSDLVGNGGTNVTLTMRVPEGADGVLARLGGFSHGTAEFAAASGTNYLEIPVVQDVTFGVEQRVGGQWQALGGGGAENGTQGWGYDEDFGTHDLRVTASAPGSRDGSSQPVEIRFVRVDSRQDCIGA